ncbi:MAG: DUF2017 family protein [bacterium]|nr:DUF2017 family protein [bacterium]
MRRFRSRSDSVEMRLSPEEVEALSLLRGVLSSVGREVGDPAAERLSVAAYPDDQEAQAEYGRLMAPELEGQRKRDRAAVASSLDAARRGPVGLSLAEADSWLMVINEARLALAARLGIEKEGWGLPGDRGGFLAPDMALLVYLTEVQDDLISALAELI